MDPKQLAKILFSSPPKSAGSIGILGNKNNTFSNVELSEICINLLLYGLEIMHDNLKTVDINSIGEEDFRALEDWFKSIGIGILIDEYEIYDKDQIMDKYYAKIVLNQGTDSFYFKNKNQENFSFVFNGSIDLIKPPFKTLNEFKYLFIKSDKLVLVGFKKI